MKFILLVALLSPILCSAQSSGFIFRDTIFNLAFDSLHNNLGNIEPGKKSDHLLKHFKNIGKEPIVITKAWGGDPYFISDYPKDPILPGKVYSFEITFGHERKTGEVNRTVGFKLSDGSVIRIQLKARYPFMADTNNITFRDTMNNFVFDSLSNNMGLIDPGTVYPKLIKHFKYIGKEPMVITRAWTGDPHFICKYPTEPLIPGKIYSCTICFAHQGKQGTMNKSMGFNFSDGTMIRMNFKGEYPKVQDNLPITK